MPSRLPSTPPVISGYAPVRPLGSGGFADVFLFQQDMPRRQVAVKVLLKDFIDPDVLRLFNAEADIMAQLSAHPSILTVYDASVSADGRPYLVMEYCPDGYGRAFRKTPLRVGDALNIGVKMASALETAHRMGVLHRDVKPSNILKTSFGSPVLSDFGIATSLLGDSQNSVFAMSVPWSAPEVVSESTTGTVASEVWSLGATIYSLIAGRSPFEVDDSGLNGRGDLKKRIEKAQYVSIPQKGIPVEVEHVLLKSMMKNPAQRQVSMLEFAMELQETQQALGVRPTQLEVAVDKWAAGSEVNFDDDNLRGATISAVDVSTTRRPKTRASLQPRENPDDAVGAPRRRIRFGPSGKLVLVILGIAAVSFGITWGVLTALGVLG